MRLCSRTQPYPGLRPFEPEEAMWFRGRSREIERLSGMVREQRFVAVLGSSGAGKSSLILAGVLPALDADQPVDRAAGWQVLRLRPGGAPFRALADAAARLACSLHDEPDTTVPILRDRALGLLRRSATGLHQVVAEFGLLPGTRLLLLVDQFEELFRFTGVDRRAHRHAADELRDRGDEAAAFSASLVAVSRADGVPVHVVITMRSDFVGECARFLGLPEAVDAGQFLVPRMSRAQLEAAVREPLCLAGATISPALVQRVLNDAGTQPDGLPVLQHALSRTWEEAGRTERGPETAAAGLAEAPTPFNPGLEEMSLAFVPERMLLPRHYKDAGTMAGALSDHANSILGDLSKKNAELPGIARWLFRALSDIDKEGRAVRRPQRFAELVALMGLRHRRLVERVLDRFREDDCNFLTPSRSAVPKLRADTVVDVAHEALLRNWDKLKGLPGHPGWLAEEFTDGNIWRSLAVEADAFATDETRTLSEAATTERGDWLRGRPSAYWARRHARRLPGGESSEESFPEWGGVGRLVAASTAAAGRRSRLRKAGMVGTLLVAIVFALLSVYAWVQADRARAQELQTLRNESLLLAQLARERTAAGYSVTGMQLALRGLPSSAVPDRPFVGETLGALAVAMGQQREVSELRGHEGWVWSVAFAADGRLASRGEDGTVRVVWVGPSVEGLVAEARRRLPRELTEAEERRYYLRER